MAAINQVKQEGDIWAGLATSGTIPERFLKRGIDRMGQMAYITRGYTRFLSLMHMRYPKSSTVNTREFKTQEISELERVVNVTVSSVSTTGRPHSTFGVANDSAATMEVNGMYYIKGLHVAIKGTSLVTGQVYPSTNLVPTSNIPPALGVNVGLQPTSVHYSPVWGQDSADATLFFVDKEPVKILDVGAPNSAGSGHTTITVERCFKAVGTSDLSGWMVCYQAPGLVDTGLTAGTGSNAGQITTDMQLLRGLPTFPEGTGLPTGFHKNPIVDTNFTQEFKYAVEITNESEIESTYLAKSPLEINKMLRMQQSSLDMERTFLEGQKGKTRDAQGRMTYTTGGVIEYIPKDVNHILRYTGVGINYPELLRLGDKVHKLGGGQKYDAFVGLELYTELKIAFYSSGYLRYDEDASREFDIPVETLVMAGGEWAIHPLYSLSELGMGNKMILIDSTKPCFEPVTHDGWDMKVIKDAALKGEEIYKEAWVGIKGLRRRYKDYLAMVEFPI